MLETKLLSFKKVIKGAFLGSVFGLSFLTATAMSQEGVCNPNLIENKVKQAKQEIVCKKYLRELSDKEAQQFFDRYKKYYKDFVIIENKKDHYWKLFHKGTPIEKVFESFGYDVVVKKQPGIEYKLPENITFAGIDDVVDFVYRYFDHFVQYRGGIFYLVPIEGKNYDIAVIAEALKEKERVENFLRDLIKNPSGYAVYIPETQEVTLYDSPSGHRNFKKVLEKFKDKFLTSYRIAVLLKEGNRTKEYITGEVSPLFPLVFRKKDTLLPAYGRIDIAPGPNGLVKVTLRLGKEGELYKFLMFPSDSKEIQYNRYKLCVKLDPLGTLE